MKQYISFYFSIVLFLSVLCSCQQTDHYRRDAGNIFGTTYSIIYECDSDLNNEIIEKLHEIDKSLNPFDPSSIISQINRNEDVETDEHFEKTYQEAVYISSLTQGAFDITVGPLVNLWGFGFKNKEVVTQHKIDSLLHFVNFLNTNLVDHRLYKTDQRIILDCGAIAKGYACDVIAKLFDSHDCMNYLVEIGGELVCKGSRKDGKKWRLGITKPVDDMTGENLEIQDTIYASNLRFATSGNYRNYYYDGEKKRSHTIDPRTGYPVEHKLLSATVFASSCARADALATTCMVMGETDAMELIESIPDVGCYFILSSENGQEYEIMKSSLWKTKIDKINE